MNRAWRAALPLAITGVLLLLSPPTGLAPHAWRFFAIFVGVIVALMCEPLPGAALGLLGITLITTLAPAVLYSPAELAKPGFNPVNAALTWALSGFANTTVWLIFSAFAFALGYEKTGLGRRIALLLVKAMGRRTLTLGYAIAFADGILAPFTPSNTARSAGTIYPIIRNLPELYDSKPRDPSARKIGAFLMWVAISTTCVTSSMFLTGQAANVLGVELARTTAKVEVTWMQWLIAFGPVGVVLLLATPWLVYVLYPPTVKESEAVPTWAARQLAELGPLSKREVGLAALVLLALGLWIGGGSLVNATTAALIVTVLMMITGIVSWNDILANQPAWNTFAWFASLVALADGLGRVGFIKWFADRVAGQMGGLTPFSATLVLVVVYFAVHYMFASLTAQVTAMFPIMLALASKIPGLDLHQFTLTLLVMNGIMGILTPYGTGPSPVYYGTGYLSAGEYWKYGALFGAIFLAVFLIIGLPWLQLVH
ncbi:MAG TPA: anion permease [Aggregatilineales bacterium]|nr:anion permease [Candidatus Baltobacteraceae bacterium]HVO41939.1 anion permease [Aggregatilineales bacterium]